MSMSMSGDSGQRVGSVEREAAIEALNRHWRAGRLDPAEHERRTTAAYAAATRGDLDTLFADLPGGAAEIGPGPRDAASGTSTQQVAVPGAAAPPAEPSRGGGLFSADSWVGQRRDAIMGVTPFVALAMFFLTKSWLWFLLIPALGAALYAGDDSSNSKRSRRRQREERRREE